ncbi:hypothetical protein Asi03nite_09580 [Actinoplanes siamensis]|uniref:Uncharacterized protein n=1 Tax=Actinoplanes siamensis TaxID=1223317 RepID=A0A919N134_9ACTN|nr:hypothetical protein Asi03nite_09580 [Actinoplanes siamensis]
MTAILAVPDDRYLCLTAPGVRSVVSRRPCAARAAAATCGITGYAGPGLVIVVRSTIRERRGDGARLGMGAGAVRCALGQILPVPAPAVTVALTVLFDSGV